MINDMESIMFTKEQLADKVAELGQLITRDYEGKNPLMVAILKGAVVFYADIVRAVDTPAELDFMMVSSYGCGTESSGQIKIKKDLEQDIKGRHVILVEDIIDSGITMHGLMGMLKDRGAASVKLCALMSKPSRRKVEVNIDYCGFEVPDEFLVGYGLDYAEKYRNLPYIGVLKRELYS